MSSHPGRQKKLMVASDVADVSEAHAAYIFTVEFSYSQMLEPVGA
jgi:hypothetical protein